LTHLTSSNILPHHPTHHTHHMHHLPRYFKNKHCNYCGTEFVTKSLNCLSCSNTTYQNPEPVAVGILKYSSGLLLVRRSVPPHINGLCFPGGYIDRNETWQQAIQREIFEETGIETDSNEFTLFNTISSPNNKVLIFGISNKIRTNYSFVPNSEVSELVIGQFNTKLCFDIHQQIFDLAIASE